MTAGGSRQQWVATEALHEIAAQFCHATQNPMDDSEVQFCRCVCCRTQKPFWKRGPSCVRKLFSDSPDSKAPSKREPLVLRENLPLAFHEAQLGGVLEPWPKTNAQTIFPRQQL